MNKKIFLAFAFLLPLSLMAQDLKFGFFNRTEIFQNMPEYLAATKKIEDLALTYDTELKSIQEEYQKKGSEFIAAKDSLPEAIKTRRMAEIQGIQERLDAFYQESQKEIQKTQQELLTPVNTKMLNAVKAVGNEQGFVYILDTSVNAVLMYWSPDKCVDVTPLVRAKLNMK